MIVDTHCHLDDEIFTENLNAEIEANVAHGVQWMLSQGVSLESSARTVQIAAQFPEVYAAVGVHPNCILRQMEESGHTAYSPAWRDEVMSALEALAARPKVVAIGETGLDDYWKDVPMPMQVDFLEAHLALARKTHLPVVIHCRQSETELLRVLEAEHTRHGALRGVLHSFSGNVNFLYRCLELGLYISYSGSVTYKNRKYDSLRETVARVPAERLLLETDAPYLIPTQARKQTKTNHPWLACFTARTLAELRGVTEEDILRLTSENAHRLFAVAGVL